MVVWLTTTRAEISWAKVEALDCCHDSLDAGIPVADFDLDSKQPDFGPVFECIRKQISEPLTFRRLGHERATILVRNEKGTLSKVGEVGKVLRRSHPTHDIAIRLTDPEPPPVSDPSGADRWFDSGNLHRRGLPRLRTFPITDDTGIVFAFEIHAEFLCWPLARRLGRIPGVSEVRPRKWWTRFREEVHIRFKYQNREYIVWEPYGDNSRWWIGPDDDTGPRIPIDDLERAIKHS